MTPQELARDIAEELAEALTELELPQRLSVVDVGAPKRIDADSCLYVTIAARGGPTAKMRLPSSLAVAYLADEEAAVDEWKHWIRDIADRFAT